VTIVTIVDHLKMMADNSRKYVVSAMTANVRHPRDPSSSAPNASQKPQTDSLIPAKDCFSKKDLIDALTKVQVAMQDKWLKIAETPPKSVAVYEDVDLVRRIIEQLKA
jgi:hypothetical protein